MFGNYDQLFGLLHGSYKLPNLEYLLHLNKGQKHNMMRSNGKHNRLPGLQSSKTAPLPSVEPGSDAITINMQKPSPMDNRLLNMLYKPDNIMKNHPGKAPEIENQPSPSTQTQTELTEQKFLNMVNLNLDFNIEDFEKVLTTIVEDAQDGNFEVAAINNIDIGLNVDFQAKAKMTETYRIDGNNADAKGIEFERNKTQQMRELKALMKTREFEANLFYRENLKANYSSKKHYADGFIRVSRKLAIRYTQDISLNLKSLNMYNEQARDLTDDEDIKNYLSNTETMVDNPEISGELIGQFFETVQLYIDKAENNLIEKVNSYFNNLTQQLGVNPEYLGDTKERLLESVSVFFDKVDQTVNSFRNNHIADEQTTEQITEPETAADNTTEPVEQTAVA
ncbi:MAG: hypothetical protein J7K40_05790 [candidate division Zixibacteria bacterium]|nr:hypothetical protein [candidate division Zixibacteria bacterium]